MSKEINIEQSEEEHAIKRYLNNGGNFCLNPNCFESCVTEEIPDENGDGSFNIKCECETCGWKWIKKCKLNDVILISKNEK